MPYLLITGIIFFAVPLIVIQGFAFFILLNFVRDDNDAGNIFRMGLMFMGFGLFLIIFHVVFSAIT